MKSRNLLLLPACGEKVGMRGPFRRAQDRGNAPSPSLAELAGPVGSLDLSPHAGR
jgi:hypothetical protein